MAAFVARDARMLFFLVLNWDRAVAIMPYHRPSTVRLFLCCFRLSEIHLLLKQPTHEMCNLEYYGLVFAGMVSLESIPAIPARKWIVRHGDKPVGVSPRSDTELPAVPQIWR